MHWICKRVCGREAIHRCQDLSDWFYNDVKTAVELGLVNGRSETTYAPSDNLTYAEAIKLAACMNQLYTKGVNQY